MSCFARKSDPEVTDENISPFLVQYGTDFTPLGYLNSFLDIGRFTSEVNVHTFDSSLSTPTTCAVRVGDGYSTNSVCQNLGCGGAECDAPSQYLIQPAAGNLYCTTEPKAQYTIGCAPGDTYAACIDPETDNPTSQNLYHGLVNNKKKLTFRFNDTVIPSTSPEAVEMTCDPLTIQTNENTTPTCTISLPTGQQLAMLVATDPIDQYQVIYDVIPRDTEPPTALITDVDTGTVSSDGKRLTAVGNQWLNKPVTVTVTCQNELVENNDTCTCDWLLQYQILDENRPISANSVSSFKRPVLLRDMLKFQRFIKDEALEEVGVVVFDNVGNHDFDR